MRQRVALALQGFLLRSKLAATKSTVAGSLLVAALALLAPASFAYADTGGWTLEQPRTGWFLADGEHHAVWAGPGPEQATLFDTRTRQRRVVPLPGRCYSVVNQNTIDARLAASGRALLTCPLPPPTSAPTAPYATDVGVVLDLTTGATTVLPLLAGSGFWQAIGKFWASSTAGTVADVQTGAPMSGRYAASADLDQRSLPSAAPCHRVADAASFGIRLRNQARSFGSIVRPRRVGKRWLVERVSCSAIKVLARESLFPQGFQVRGGITSWTTASRPELAYYDGKPQGATVTVTTSSGRRLGRWLAPERRLDDCDGTGLGAYGRSFHTLDRVFYAAATRLESGKVCTLVSEAIYSRPYESP